MHIPLRWHQQGASLLEVLVALLILSLGILGMMALQGVALKSNQAAVNRSLATEMANEITDLMRANRTRALAGNYDIALSGSVPSGNDINNVDLRAWKSRLARLPAGQGSVSHSGQTMTITVQWSENRLAGGHSDQQFVYRTEL